MAPNLNFVNVFDPNKVLRSEVFMSEDRKLRAIHLILDFKPLFDKFQDMGNAIRTGDPWLARIDISMPGFLAREDILPIELPSYCAPLEVVVPREEIASLRMSLEAKIDQFHLEEERDEQEEPVIQVSNLEDELDRSSSIRTPQFIVTRVDDGSEEEEEMALNRKKGLCELLADKAKGSAPKDTSGSQPPFSLPPLPPPAVNLFAPTNLKKRKKEKEVASKPAGRTRAVPRCAFKTIHGALSWS